MGTNYFLIPLSLISVPGRMTRKQMIRARRKWDKRPHVIHIGKSVYTGPGGEFIWNIHPDKFVTLLESNEYEIWNEEFHKGNEGPLSPTRFRQNIFGKAKQNLDFLQSLDKGVDFR